MTIGAISVYVNLVLNSYLKNMISLNLGPLWLMSTLYAPVALNWCR